MAKDIMSLVMQYILNTKVGRVKQWAIWQRWTTKLTNKWKWKKRWQRCCQRYVGWSRKFCRRYCKNLYLFSTEVFDPTYVNLHIAKLAIMSILGCGCVRCEKYIKVHEAWFAVYLQLLAAGSTNCTMQNVRININRENGSYTNNSSFVPLKR